MAVHVHPGADPAGGATRRPNVAARGWSRFRTWAMGVVGALLDLARGVASRARPRAQPGAELAVLTAGDAELVTAARAAVATARAHRRDRDAAADAFVRLAVADGRVHAGDVDVWRNLYVTSAASALELLAERSPGTWPRVGSAAAPPPPAPPGPDPALSPSTAPPLVLAALPGVPREVQVAGALIDTADTPAALWAARWTLSTLRPGGQAS